MANEPNDINNQDGHWELGLDIDDSDLRLTPALCPSSNTQTETSHSNQNQVKIIPGPAGIVQQAKMLKEKVLILSSDGALMSTQEYIQKVVKDVGEDDDFKRKLDQVDAIVKSCSPNAIGDLTVTMKDLTSTIPALGWHLEEIHVTWAHLEKKRTRLRLYTKNHEELFIQSLEMASQP
ncbi:hypothetical protein Tco_0221836 [Tanacetum coccineum]